MSGPQSPVLEHLGCRFHAESVLPQLRVRMTWIDEAVCPDQLAWLNSNTPDLDSRLVEVGGLRKDRSMNPLLYAFMQRVRDRISFWWKRRRDLAELYPLDGRWLADIEASARDRLLQR